MQGQEDKQLYFFRGSCKQKLSQAVAVVVVVVVISMFQTIVSCQEKSNPKKTTSDRNLNVVAASFYVPKPPFSTRLSPHDFKSNAAHPEPHNITNDIIVA